LSIKYPEGVTRYFGARALDEHQRCAERHAHIIGERLGLDGEHLSMLKLAARLHDEGKAAPRWQRAFRAERSAVKAGTAGPLAKTDGPIDFALLDGYRHELGSLLKAEADPRLLELRPELRELALHLIAAHHGFARPVISPRSCDVAPPSALRDRVREIALRFALLQARWGPWGLAWWESLLRAADQLASRENAQADLEVHR
jgi:CRISPR-associated endonuclease/helicase Cas3